jgi:dienelactone hydrolase
MQGESEYNRDQVNMSIKETALEWTDGDTTCKGFYYTPDDKDTPLPVVMLCPAWDGVGEEIKGKARRLAGEGYITLTVDVLGGGHFESDFTRLQKTLAPFFMDRAMLLRRLEAAVGAARELPGADAKRIAVLGYCFGGTCALDLIRSTNPDIKAAASFHGGLTASGLDHSGAITAPILVMHGHDDPLVPQDQVAAFQQEMTEREADWQFVAYGHTVHAFTRPEANNPDFGAVYNAAADRRSWQSMLNFMAEVL